MEFFTWKPGVDATGTTSHRTLVAQFGDGYAQRVGDGINTKQEVWPLQFVGKASRIKQIRDFLDTHAGFKSFLWRPPLGIMGELQAYVAPDGYEIRSVGANELFVLTVTFKQSNRAIAP